MNIGIGDLNRQLANASPEDIIRKAQQTFGKGLVMTSSFGTGSAVMLRMVTSIVPSIPVIVIDTGYFFEETYAYMGELQSLFNLNLVVRKSPISPQAMEWQYGKLWKHGPIGLQQYNQIRKVWPMEKALRELSVTACIAGLRRDQTDHRRTLRAVEQRINGLYDVYPILEWSQEQVDGYFFLHDLPQHPLVEKGYSSVGDQHSTMPTSDRTGRFLGLHQECGLHTHGKVATTL